MGKQKVITDLDEFVAQPRLNIKVLQRDQTICWPLILLTVNELDRLYKYIRCIIKTEH